MGLGLMLFRLFNGYTVGLILGLLFFISRLTWVYEDLINKRVWDVGDWGLGAFKRGFLIFIFTECMFLARAIRCLLYILGVEGYSVLILRGFSQDCIEVPFLISVVLLRSGVRITAFHNMFHVFIINFFNITMMVLTIVLGLVFLTIQYEEWVNSNLIWCDGFYGSIFYFITGFHGLHVLIGLILLRLLIFGLIVGLGVNFREAGYECLI